MTAAELRGIEARLFAALTEAACDADRRKRLLAAWDAVRCERVLAEVTEVITTTAEEVGSVAA